MPSDNERELWLDSWRERRRRLDGEWRALFMGDWPTAEPETCRCGHAWTSHYDINGYDRGACRILGGDAYGMCPCLSFEGAS